MISLKTINNQIAKPLGVNLVQGEGYFYLIGTPMQYATETSIYVTKVNHLSLEEWKAEITRLVEAAKKETKEEEVSEVITIKHNIY